MAAIIEIMGHIVSYDGEHWTSEEPAAAGLCKTTAVMLPYCYYPDPVNGLAKAVAKALKGRVISEDPVTHDDEPPEHMAY